MMGRIDVNDIPFMKECLKTWRPKNTPGVLTSIPPAFRTSMKDLLSSVDQDLGDRDANNAVSSPRRQTRRVSSPGQLKDIYKDSGSIPSYLKSFDEVFGEPSTSSKFFRHSLSGEPKESRHALVSLSPSSGAKAVHDVETDSAPKMPNRVSSPRRSSKISALADTFLRKVVAPVQSNKTISRVPSIQVVKSVKGRWPPKSNIATRIETNAMKERIPKQMAGVSTKRMKARIESNIIFHAKLLRQENNVPLELASDALLASASHGALKAYNIPGIQQQSPIVLSHPKDLSPLASPVHYDDDSTISSKGLWDLRPSYKVCYTGPMALKRGREWEDGVVDTSFPLMPRPGGFEDDHRFDTSIQDAGLPGAPNQHRFEADGVDASMSALLGSDRWFEDLGGGNDHSLPGVPGTDRRFESGDAPSWAPSRPGRQDSILLPAVWQTRACQPGQDDLAERKWRLKRVWEEDNKVVDDSEPDYVVAESHLREALTALLCVLPVSAGGTAASSLPNSLSEDPESKSPVPSKYWKVTKVWDRSGDVVATKDEESLEAESLFELFEDDKCYPKDSLVFEYSLDALSIKLDNDKGIVPNQNQEAENWYTLEASDEAEDSSDGDYNCCSLSESIQNSADLEQHMAEVEKEVNDVMSEGGDSSEARRNVQRLQEHISIAMCQLEEAEVRGHTASSEQAKVDIGLDGSLSSESDDGDDCSRDGRLIRRKLRKTERLMMQMLSQKGEEARRRKKFKSLDKKRIQYFRELGGDCQNNERAPTRRQHSMLDSLGMDVIEEESVVSGDMLRDNDLIRRKIRKVQKALARIVATEGAEAIKRKSYQRLREKRSQYFTEFERNHDNDGKGGISRSGVAEQCVQQALAIAKGTEDPIQQTQPRRATSLPTKYRISTTNPTENPRNPYHKFKNYYVKGRWSSPLDR